MEEENPQSMKPVYKFEFASGLVRRTDELENDSKDFTEPGIEKLAEKGRADDECTVTLVGYSQI